MSLEFYKNKDEILAKKNGTSADRFTVQDSNLIKYTEDYITYMFPDVPNKRYGLEFHAYSVTGTYLNSKYNVNYQQYVRNSSNSQGLQTTPTIPLNFKAVDIIKNLGLSSGQYRYVVNFFVNIIGSETIKKLFIQGISPDRTELELNLIHDELLSEIQNDYSYLLTRTLVQKEDNILRPLILNLGANRTILITNYFVADNLLYVKLYDPLPLDIQEKEPVWISEEFRSPFIDTVFIQPSTSNEQFNIIKGPDLDLQFEESMSRETDYKNWEDILNTDSLTSAQLVEQFISSSNAENINIDYTDLNNFINFSSAEERVKNFKYKVELIEYYDARISTLQTISGSSSNILEFQSNKNKLVSGFDGFEKYLYNNTGSGYFFTNPVAPAYQNVSGSFHIDPWPKSSTTRPYTLYNSTSSVVTDWYESALAVATTYDNLNNNKLIDFIPSYLKIVNGGQPELITFVNMMGHHFDVLYSYVRHLEDLRSREEHPKLGLSRGMMEEVARSFGWKLVNGNQYRELYNYAFGLSGSGSFQDASQYGSKTGEDLTQETWKRIVNNLPYMLKTKGTKRSITALLSCYGIPATIITIKEYGGPSVENRTPIYEKLNFDYALRFNTTNPTSSVVTNWDTKLGSSTYPKQIEMRFKTLERTKQNTFPSQMELFSLGTGTGVVLNSSGSVGNEGYIDVYFSGALLTSTATLPLFDADWNHIALSMDTTGSVTLDYNKVKWGKITKTLEHVDGTTTGSWYTGTTFTLGDNSLATRFQGEIQEVRFWNEIVSGSALQNHAKAASAYNGNDDFDSYDNLAFRLPLTQKTDHTLTSSMISVHPNQNYVYSASFVDFASADAYDSVEETYYFDSVRIGNSTYDDNKIRVDSNTLSGTLAWNRSVETSKFYNAEIDDNKIGVYFSPQTIYNEDIISQLGFVELDDYIGDPRDKYKNEYPELKRISRLYWRKFTDENDFNEYIRLFTLFDMSFFKQLEQLLPARADKLTGVLIQPTILERNKGAILRKPEIESPNYSGSLLLFDYDNSIEAEYTTYSGSFTDAVTTLTGSFELYEATIDYIDPYASSSYCHTYLYYTPSGSWLSITTGSSPSWICDVIQPTYSGSNIGFNWTGRNNMFYDGSKMTSANFNTPSKDTVDGGPVVEINTVLGNQLQYQNNNASSGSFLITQ